MLYSERTRFRQTMKSRSFYKFYRSSRRCDFASIILLILSIVNLSISYPIKTGLGLPTNVLTKNKTNTILPSGLTDNLYTRIQSRTYSPNLKQNTALNTFLATDSGTHIVQFMKDYKKMADAVLHSSFLVLPAGIEPTTNP